MAVFELVPPFAEPAYIAGIQSPYYSETHRQLRERMRSHIDTHILPKQLEWEAAGEVPAEEARRWRDAGFASTMVPREFKKPGQTKIAGVLETGTLDVFHELVMTDEGSRIEGGVGIGLERCANVIGAPPIIYHANAQQRKSWLPAIASGEMRTCLAITEPSGGSDVGRIKTTARRSPDGAHYVVSGHKKWITGAPWATHATAAVRTGGESYAGISLLVVPLTVPGVSIRRIANSGQSAGGASWITFDDVKVPAENLLGKEGAGFKMIMTNFNRERFALAVGCNRKARTCLSEAWAYARDRETFGAPLLERQAIRHKLMHIAERVEAHWAWLEQLCYHVQVSPQRWQDKEIAGRMALCKIQGGKLLELAAREAAQVMGGVAYQKGNVVEQITRDLRMMVVGGGSEEILADLAFKQAEAKFQLEGAAKL